MLPNTVDEVTPAALERARTLVEPALRMSVSTLDEHLQTPAAYHLGWVEADGTPTTANSGKGLRSALAVLGAESVGATGTDARPAAVAVELIHNFSLIHDDIMDNDRLRRHRPTVWDVFGVGDAIIVGDALHTLAFQTILEVDADLVAPAVARLGSATTEMIAGQANDVSLDRAATAEVSLDRCLAMESQKTGALLAQSVALGALLGRGSDSQQAALESYGRSLGLAFQVVDDVLGIWGDTATTGKPVGNDLREKKKSIPIAMALSAGGDTAAQVVAAFDAPDEPDAPTISALTTALDEAGVRGEAEALADRLLDEALASIDDPTLAPGARDELVDVARFVTSRDR